METAKKKKTYVKPMLVFEDFKEGKLYGSPEMIEQIIKEGEEKKAELCPFRCPFDPFL